MYLDRLALISMATGAGAVKKEDLSKATETPRKGEQLLMQRLAALEASCTRQHAANRASIDALADTVASLDAIAGNLASAEALADVKASVDALADVLRQLLPQADTSAVQLEQSPEKRQATLRKRSVVRTDISGPGFLEYPACPSGRLLNLVLHTVHAN